MMRVIIFSVLLLTTTSAAYNFDLEGFTHESIQEADIEVLFDLYLQHLAPSHISSTPERYTHFKKQVLDIIAHNNNSKKTWKKAITKFTGMTLKELEGSAIMAPQYCSATNGLSSVGLIDLPSSYDWRDKGIITTVKDQGECGSCWTFSTTGAVESHWALYKKSAPPLLSEQQLIDCAGAFNNHGCNGGLPSQAFEYIKSVGGLESEQDYPYQGIDGKCHFRWRKTIAKVSYGSANITEGDEKALLEAAFSVGPISVAFEVTDDFMNYHSGVYVGETCRNTTQTVNHAVLAVGFGTDPVSKLDYWIVKNSWGIKWGEQGYFKIQRGVNMCGIAVCASYPRMKKKMELETY